jgi:hypothetical protein
MVDANVHSLIPAVITHIVLALLVACPVFQSAEDIQS